MPHDDLDLSCRLHDRAVAARADGKYGQAESLGQRALALLERAAGPDHPDVANVLNHLAGLHVDRSEYAKAEALYQRAVRIMEQCTIEAPVELKASEGDGLTTGRRCSADFQSAVSPNCIRQGVGDTEKLANFRQRADCKSAKQQIENLRYGTGRPAAGEANGEQKSVKGRVPQAFAGAVDWESPRPRSKAPEDWRTQNLAEIDRLHVQSLGDLACSTASRAGVCRGRAALSSRSRDRGESVCPGRPRRSPPF